MNDTEGIPFRYVTLDQIPEKLLSQKGWDAEIGLARLRENSPNLVSVLLGPDIALGIMMIRPEFKDIWVDTVIVDEDVRCYEMVRLCLRTGIRLAMDLARKLEFKTVSWSTMHPDRHREMISGICDPKDKEVVQVVEV